MLDQDELPPENVSAEQDMVDLTGLDSERLYAAFSYLAVLVVVPLLTAKDNPFVNFHIRQGLLVLGGLIIGSIAANWSAVVGGTLLVLILIADIVALVQALQGRTWKIPGLGQLAEKIRI